MGMDGNAWNLQNNPNSFILRKSLKNMSKLFTRLTFSSIFTNVIRFLLIIEFINALQHNRTLALSFSVIAFLATFLPKLFNKLNIKIGAETEIVILMIIYGSLFLGEVQTLVPNTWWWPVLLRAVAGIALSFIGLTIILTLENEELIDASPFIIVVLSFSVSFTLGALWELLEFSLDSLLGFGIQNLGTGSTIQDLFITAVSAIVISIGGYIYTHYTGRNILSSSIINWMRNNPQIFRSKKNLEVSSEKIKGMIQAGEGSRLEFKASLRTNLHTNSVDRAIETAILKTITAYLNTDGGTIIVGVSDSGEILGLEKDAFPNKDKLKLHLNNLIKERIGSQFMTFIQYEIFPIEDKHVLKIDCLPSIKRVFLKDGKEEEFYVRNGPSSAKLSGSSMIDYINHRFKE